MSNDDFQKTILEFASLLNAKDHGHRKDLWASAGVDALDTRLTAVADFYWEAPPDQRKAVRDVVEGNDTWELVAYVRRVAMLIVAEDDFCWLKRGLSVACIENSRFDYRDLIVSLILLRFAAERAGIATRSYFDQAMAISDSKLHGVLKNARDHSAANIKSTVLAFGPPAWKAI